MDHIVLHLFVSHFYLCLSCYFDNLLLLPFEYLFAIQFALFMLHCPSFPCTFLEFTSFSCIFHQVTLFCFIFLLISLSWGHPKDIRVKALMPHNRAILRIPSLHNQDSIESHVRVLFVAHMDPPSLRLYSYIGIFFGYRKWLERSFHGSFHFLPMSLCKSHVPNSDRHFHEQVYFPPEVAALRF